MSEIKWRRKENQWGHLYYESEAGHISAFRLARVWYAYPDSNHYGGRRCDTLREAKAYCETAWRARQ